MLARVVVLFAVFAALGCGKKNPAPDGTPNPQGGQPPGPSADTDEQKVQGVWKLVAAELPDEPAPPPEALTGYRFPVKENVLTVSRDGGRQSHYTFKADPTTATKTVDFTHCDEKGVPLEERFRADVRGIYKFEGGEFVIALAVEGSKRGYRPTEFKASRVVGDGPGKGHMVAVLRVKKADPNEPVVPGVRPKPKTSSTRK